MLKITTGLKKIATAVVLTTLASSALATTDAAVNAEVLNKIAAGDHRSDNNRSRNAFRHPAETLEFFGIKPSMTVVELWPGGGWYTEILAPYLKADGKLIAANFQVDGADLKNRGQAYRAKAGQKFRDKIAANKAIWGDVEEVTLAPPAITRLSDSNSVDMVLTFRNLHNWEQSGAMESVFMAAYDALKPGGVFGVVEHRAPYQVDTQEQSKTGYMSEQYTISLAVKVGFKLDRKSQVNANTRDTKDHPRGVWTLPPSLALGEQDRAKYLAIGESDRMTLRFVKPAKK